MAVPSVKSSLVYGLNLIWLLFMLQRRSAVLSVVCILLRFNFMLLEVTLI